MADEVGSAALQSGQKIVEVSVELIKMLAPLAEKLLSTVFHKSVDGLNTVGGIIADTAKLKRINQLADVYEKVVEGSYIDNLIREQRELEQKTLKK